MILVAVIVPCAGERAPSQPMFHCRLYKGTDKLSIYQFNTMTAKHYFCSICGIHTHHQTRANPELYGFNLACLEGVNPFDLGEVRVNDGINHISDQQTELNP